MAPPRVSLMYPVLRLQILKAVAVSIRRSILSAHLLGFSGHMVHCPSGSITTWVAGSLTRFVKTQEKGLISGEGTFG